MSDTNLFLRDDTFFGVCEGLGEDLGFNPNWLRLAFGVSLLLNPVAGVGIYCGLGALVLLSRLIVRNPRPAPSAASAPAPADEAQVQVELPLAA